MPISDHLGIMPALLMYQWDRPVFLPRIQFGHGIDEDNEVFILAFVKHLTVYQLLRSLTRCALVRKLTLTWVTFPRGILLAADRGEDDNEVCNVRNDRNLSSHELRQGWKGGAVLRFNRGICHLVRR
jgi:hypothetical protein